jgi:hypothetical protein
MKPEMTNQGGMGWSLIFNKTQNYVEDLKKVRDGVWR